MGRDGIAFYTETKTVTSYWFGARGDRAREGRNVGGHDHEVVDE